MLYADCCRTQCTLIRIAYHDDMTSASTTPLLPAYLVTGTDDLKKEAVIRRLHERIAREGDLSFNRDEFDGAQAQGEAIVASCNTLPFASPVRLVEVFAADRLKGSDVAQVIEYLAAPNNQTVLCLVATGLAKNTRLYKAVAKLGAQAVIDCAPPTRRDLPKKVSALAASQGVSITQAAIGTLIDLVGENTVALNAEIRKLALAHRGSDAINENEVRALVSRTNEAKPWEFVDAFSSRNVERCLVIRAQLGDISAYRLLALCVTRIRELIMTKALVNRGQVQTLPDLLHLPAWRVKNHVTWARGFSVSELHRALESARDTELAMKSGANPEESFESWWLGVVC